jgi:hypothetical protein
MLKEFQQALNGSFVEARRVGQFLEVVQPLIPRRFIVNLMIFPYPRILDQLNHAD